MPSPWLIAVKPPALLKILLPILVGLSAGIHSVGWGNFRFAIVLVLFAALTQLFIVLLNDYADAESDARHQKTFPALLDVRVIPNDLISEKKILAAGLTATVLLLVGGGVLAVWFRRPDAPWLVIAGLFLFAAYSFPPFKLNYRGGGELLETLGVGCLLPVFGFYIYSGVHQFEIFLYVLPCVPLASISALASGLKHEPADRLNGKRTFCVIFGAQKTNRFIVFLQAATLLICVAYFLAGMHNFALLMLGGGIPAILLNKTRRLGKTADYQHVPDLNKFKKLLLLNSLTTYAGLALSFLTLKIF